MPEQQLTAWPADKIERRELAQLMPSATNSRTHTPQQVDQLAASIVQWGWTVPVLIDDDNTVIAGHGRVLAAERLAINEIPVVVARAWSDAQKRAYLIADNKLTELGGWDNEILQRELADLAARDFDITLTGFDASAVMQLEQELRKLGEADWKQHLGGEATPEQRKLLDQAWRKLAAEWETMFAHMHERGYLSAEYTRATLGVYFVRALIHGEDIPRAATLPYTLHRLLQATRPSFDRPYHELCKHAQAHDNALASLQWACDGKPLLSKMLQQTLGIQGYRYPADFPALLARDLCDEFCPDNARVLDPCHGWGGRLLGYLLAKKTSAYVGYDVDEKTVKGVTQMFHDLRGYVENKQAALLCLPFEDAKLAGQFDFALTSPPYYNTEHYDGELQSWRRYADFAAWVTGFYRPLVAKTCAALKPGGVFCLQIGDQFYPLKQTALANLPAELEHIETRDADMHNHYHDTALAEGEQILVFRKRR